jgi:hypothetical protein
MSIVHVSFTVLQSFSTTWALWPISWNAVRKKIMYLNVCSLCRCSMASWLGSGNIRSMVKMIPWPCPGLKISRHSHI